MHGTMRKTKDQEGGKSPLNNGKEEDTLRLNRGVELLLRNKKRRKPRRKTFQVKFGKLVSFFGRELEIYFDFNLDLRKKSSKEE